MYTRLTLIATIRMQQGTKSYLLFRLKFENVIIHGKSILLMRRPQTPQPGFGSITLLQNLFSKSWIRACLYHAEMCQIEAKRYPPFGTKSMYRLLTKFLRSR